MGINKRITESIIKPLASIFIVGIFLIALVGTNEVIETFKAKENYYLANYQTISHYLEAFSEYELDDDTCKQVLNLMCGIADEVNANNDENISVAVYSNTNDLFNSNNDEDPLLSELICSIDPGNRKIKSNYDYYNTEHGNYRFLIRVEHDGIINILVKNDIFKKLFISSTIFAFLSIAMIIFLQFNKNLKYRRIVGIIFIFIWIGSITLTSAIDLNKQHKNIVNEEVQHITSLIEFYYRQDLIEHGDEIEDRRQFAQDNIDYFKNDNGNIANIQLNENYHEDLTELDGCLTVTINDNVQKNKLLEFILSAILFLVLALILYDKLSERIMVDDKEDECLTKLDKQILTIELINIIGNSLTWSLMLPRLMEVARINFGNTVNNYVASVYSAGVVITTIISVLSSSINRLFRNVKVYFIFTFLFGLIGISGFALIDNFAYNFIAYFSVCLADGMSGMLIYFYLAGCDNQQRKDNILIKCRSTLSIGQSIGIIIGGVFGSIFRYRTVLIIASVLVFISTILLLLTSEKGYPKMIVKFEKEDKKSIKDFFNRKQSLLFLLFIIVPLAFYDVYLDYKFPIDIINLGLTTAVISFVSMSARLISAYSSKFTYSKLRKTGLSNMTYIYLIGCTVLMLLYQLNVSITTIIIVTIVMGLLDSFGTLSYRERFIEISREENIREDDGNVIVKTGDKLGTMIGPSLINLCNNAIILPITMFGSFIIYKLLNKVTTKRN